MDVPGYETLVFPALLALCLLGFRWRPAPAGARGAMPHPGTLRSIQAARGFAALMVAVFHFTRLMQPEQYWGQVAFGGVFGFGHAGVDFFFVLSGFIICHAHGRDIGRPAALPGFAWRRASRVYPLYWFVTALVILSTALVVPDWSTRFQFDRVVGSLLLLPQAAEPVLGVGWTLLHEAAFYAVFAVGIVSRRAGSVAAAAWLALIAAGLHAAPENPLLKLLASEFNLLFLMGVLAARASLTVAVPWPRSCALLGFCALLGAGAAENAGLFPVSGLVGRLLYGAASALIVLGLVGAERAGRLRVRREAVFLGNISYALYLVHVPVISDTAWLLDKAGVIAFIPAPVLAVGALAGCIGAAWALHRWVERPLLRLARQVRVEDQPRPVLVSG